MDILDGLNPKQQDAVRIIEGPLLILAGPGSGKCVASDTLMFTNKGMIEISRIPEFFPIKKGNRCQGKIISFSTDGKKRLRNTSHWFSFKKSPTIKITTNSGYYIHGTPEHPLLVFNKEGDLRFKKLQDFIGDEMVVISLNNNLWGKENISEEMAYFIGLLVGDGVLTSKNVIGFAEGSPYLPQHFRKLTKLLYGYKNIKSYYKKGTKSVTHCISSKSIKSDLEKRGLKMTLSKYKTIPESILRAPRNSVISFLQGLFDTDASIYGVTLEYTTVSEKLARQVQLILLNLGIRSSLKPKKVKAYKLNTYWRLCITGKSLRTFAETVGFKYYVDKQKKLKKITSISSNPNLETIPYQAQRLKNVRSQILTPYCSAYNSHTLRIETKKKSFDIRKYLRGKRNPSGMKLIEILSIIPQKYKNRDIEYLMDINQNFFFDPIKSISIHKKPIPVYDFTVPRTHSFVANGFINHNTRVLTHRLAYLIQKAVSPNNILAVTFTNKAADEMRTRVARLLAAESTRIKTRNQRGKIPFVGTFHSFCLRILRQEINKLNYKKTFVIYDEEDQLKLIKKVIQGLNINKEQFPAKRVSAVISSLKSEAINWKNYQEQAQEYFEKTISKIYEAYQQELKKHNALDFDDLIMFCVQLFEKFPEVLEKYQEKFKYILVDEYQDTNPAQYQLIKLLSEKYKNLCVVGDDAQCLPKGIKVLTPKGYRSIEKISSNNETVSACGFGETSKGKIKKTHKRKYRGKVIQIKTKSGKIISITPNHIVFGKLQPKAGHFYIYLMYREDKGFRIGYTQGVRGASRNGKRIITNGLIARANQEAADKIWIIEVADNLSEAIYKEQYYAFRYGIPTTVFHDKGRGIMLTQKQIDNLYLEIETKKRAKKLMNDLLLSENYPHHFPKGVTRNYAGIFKERKIANIVMFGNKRKGQINQWHDHRISLMTTSSKLKKVIRDADFNVRAGKKGTSTWRIETARKKYIDAINFVNKLSSVGNLDIRHKARLSRSKDSFNFMPASHLRKGMLVPIYKNGKIKEEEIKKINIKNYNGNVYDLDIENLHNYISNGMVVHNSIYSFRNADFRNILNFEKDFPGAKVITLDQNYRSTQTILDAASKLISKNIYQKPKKLWTENPAGPLISIAATQDEKTEAELIVEKIQEFSEQGFRLNEFTVFYRTNTQSRALEESFIRRNIPYKLIGGVKFYQRKEIKDIVAYLKFIATNDLISLERIINIPNKKIGKTIINNIKNSKKSLLEKPLSQLIKWILKETDYRNYLKRIYGERLKIDIPEDEARWENIKELINASEGLGIKEFLERAALFSEHDEVNEKKELVHLMTLHTAKGLEFPIVFIVGCEEGILPHVKSLLNPLDIEEERRLFYVGITRSKGYLYLIFSQTRANWGNREANPPSRFLGEIPEELIKFEEYKEIDDIDF